MLEHIWPFTRIQRIRNSSMQSSPSKHTVGWFVGVVVGIRLNLAIRDSIQSLVARRLDKAVGDDVCPRAIVPPVKLSSLAVFFSRVSAADAA